MKYLICVFYKQQPERPSIAQLLEPANLQSGDRYTRVFEEEIECSNAAHETVLDELFATFNGHGNPLPANTTPIPRSMSVGDIIAIGKEALGFIVTANGFERLTFAPRGESFEITDDLVVGIEWKAALHENWLRNTTAWGAPEFPSHVPTGKSA